MGKIVLTPLVSAHFGSFLKTWWLGESKQNDDQELLGSKPCTDFIIVCDFLFTGLASDQEYPL